MASSNELTHHYRACNLCEAICGIDIVTQQGEIIAIRGDDADPLGRGHICPKAVALQDIHNDPNRLRHPLRRTPGGWHRISWREAFDEVANRLGEIQTEHGNDAVGVYLGNPTVHNYGSLLFGPPLLRTLQTRNLYSATSLDQLPHMVVASLLFGHQLLFPVPDVDRTDFFVIMGGNPLVSNGSLMSAPDIKKRLEAIQLRGGQVVVIDPRCTETARIADQHHFIRPGTDALLLLAVLQTMHAEGLVREQRWPNYVDGISTLWEWVTPYTPERVAESTGIDAEDIRALARGFAQAERAVWYGRVGVSTQAFGTLTQWLIHVVNIVTGNLDRPGGAMFPLPAIDVVGSRLAGRGGFRGRSRVRNLPEFGNERPTATMADELLTPGEGQIRGMLTLAGNPVLSAPNGEQIDKALSQLEFLVSIDIYLNETTRHAHIILPPTSPLEHANYDVVFHLLTVRNTVRYSPTLFVPDRDTRHDWEILLELQTRLLSQGFFSSLKAKARRTLMRCLGPEGLLDIGLRFGPYGSGWKFWRNGLTMNKLRRSPHGIDLGPLQPSLPERLATKSKHIALVPSVMHDELKRLEKRFFANPIPTSLLLIGRRHLLSNNSWMHNSERLTKGPLRCTLLMHPNDAKLRNLGDGDRVCVSSRVGNVEVSVALSEEMMPGVVSLPHGWGHDGRSASVNDVTDELVVDAVSGNAVFNGVPVEVVARP